MSKISCLMLTYNRFDMMVESVRCFLAQKHSDKELIIVNNGTKEYYDRVQAVVDGYDNIVHIQAKPNWELGYYRNIGLAACTGDFVATWDDDDIHHPNRLKMQMDLINSRGVDAVLLMDFTTRTITKEGAVDSAGRITMGLDGTILFRNPRDGKTGYPELRRGEDTAFLQRLSSVLKYKILVVKNDPSMYVYRFHGDNITTK